MPYLAVPVASPDELLQIAEGRWTALLATHPALAPALELQRRLITLLIDVPRSISAALAPRLSLPSRYLAAKLGKGVPVLAGEPIPIPAVALTPLLLRMCDELQAGGGGEAVEHIRAALESRSIEPDSLLAASLARDQEAIRTGAVHRGLAPDLMWLIAELAISPIAHALQHALLGQGREGALSDALTAWNHGYCPACGSWPALAEVLDGRRLLRCSFCAAAWEPIAYACIYCGEQGDAFVTAAPDVERRDRRVETCNGCMGYLKALDVRSLSPFPLIAINDLETMDLDVAAMEGGYARPMLKEFAKRS